MNRRWSRAGKRILVLAAVFVVSTAAWASAEEIREQPAETAGEAGTWGSGEAEAPAAVSEGEIPKEPEKAQESSSAAEKPVPPSGKPDGRGEGGEENEKIPDFSLKTDSYEIYGQGDSSSLLSSLKKGKNAKIVVYVKGKGIRTGDAAKKGISVSKLADSFKTSESPKVKITSEKEDDLEFTVTFSKATYLGRGNRLKFRTGFKKGGIPSQVLELPITECEESDSGGKRSRDDSTGQPVIRVKRTAPEGPVGPGEPFVLGLELQNTSQDADIEDMVLSVVPGSSVFISEDTNSTIIGRLEAGRMVPVRLNLIAGTEIGGPTQAVDLELKYNYSSGGTTVGGTSTQKVLIPVKGGTATGQPVIRISRSGLERPVRKGEEFQLTVTLQNTSRDKDVRNLAAVFEPNDQISLLEDTDTKQIGELKAGESAEIPIRLRAGTELSAAASQLIGITLKFDYDSDKGPTQGTYGERLVIPTEGRKNGPGNATPNVIIKNYTYGERVTAGQVFDLEMEFCNTSTAAAVENVVMSLDTGEGISISSSSNTFYVSRMGPGESRQQKVQMQALFQSKLQSPKITISCKYEYVDRDERKQASSSETIAIPVYQPDRFQLGEPTFSEHIRQGEEATISIPYINKGRGQVYNVEARLEGEIDALAREVNLGNFEAGKSGTIDFIVTPREKGEFRGTVYVSYEDEAAEVKTAQVSVSFEAEEEEQEDLFAPDETDGEENGGLWRKLRIPAAVSAGLAAAAWTAYSLKKRKKKDLFPEPEEWEEQEDENETEESEEEDT